MSKIKAQKSKNRVLQLFSLLMKNRRLSTLFTLGMCGSVGLATAGNTLFTQKFFESVNAASTTGEVSKAVSWGLFVGLFMAFTLILNGISDVLMENMGLSLSGFLGIEINKKAAKVDPICFENSEMLNTINKAYEGVERSGRFMTILLTNFTFYMPYFLFFLVYLFLIHPMLCLGIVFVIIPTLIGIKVRGDYYSTLEDTVAPIRREMTYYEKCLVDKEYTKETRLLGAVWFFRALYETSTLLFKKEQWKISVKSQFLELGLRSLTLMAYVFILCQLYYYMSIHVINIAIFAAVFTSVDRMFAYMDYIGYSLGEVAYIYSAVDNTLKFLELPERGGIEIPEEDYDIHLKAVCFSFPNSAENALKDINLTIKKGETIAIVGENGAGKSTLVKLLMNLYLPTEGAVFFGEHNTADIKPGGGANAISAVFQNYQRYKMRVSDNISISHTQEALNPAKLEAAIQKADLTMAHRSFTKGIDTMLSREFEGVELSGGQWQRIALGRGFYKNHNMIVLDEPTAAIDPVEETRIYKKFAELSQDKTAVIVTHRLGSAKIADRIIVMDKGRITDVGTHDELISKEGLYSEMYSAQAQWYVAG
ncbi:ABC transporter ATP-binding protein [Fusibacter sp. 3D3]|uniref:ABC transporter ATP-binding protein n=1 Tax=Fusibacter sp. 3D3 TaxID=1048380 RepID=UPI000853E3D1|nr:ABC transporter ATP-binding protein [Fusibacter sp. 3D3]GAU75932.1 transport ATP-binding protein CydD [Fusibacter sp. 3D3]